MIRTMRCLGFGMMLLLAAAVPAAQAQEGAGQGEPAVETPAGVWDGILSWLSAVFAGGGPFIDPNGRGTSVPDENGGSRLLARDGGPFIDPNG